METKPLYVRLPRQQAENLDRMAERTGVSKQRLVTEMVSGGLVMGHAEFTPNAEPVGEVLTLGEAAAFLRFEEAAVRKAAEKGEVPGRKMAGEWRFSRSALADWLRGGG